MGKNLTIWTASSSTGEEAISLLALALSMNVNLTLYASDIDDKALESLKKGQYSTFSLRPDGQKYHKLFDTKTALNRLQEELRLHKKKNCDLLNRSSSENRLVDQIPSKPINLHTLFYSP